MMAQGSFTAQVSAWCQQSEDRVLAVFKMAAQYTIDDMQLSVGEGGHMPVDTGFLRASLQVEDQEPSAALTMRPDDSGVYVWDTNEYQLVIAGLELGETLWATYGAVYARFQEYGFGNYAGKGFVRLAAQNWVPNVNKAQSELMARNG